MNEEYYDEAYEHNKEEWEKAKNHTTVFSVKKYPPEEVAYTPIVE